MTEPKYIDEKFHLCEFKQVPCIDLRSGIGWSEFICAKCGRSDGRNLMPVEQIRRAHERSDQEAKRATDEIPLLKCALGADGWIRLWGTGPGISWKVSDPLFSERYGYKKPFCRIGRLRMFWLKAVDK